MTTDWKLLLSASPNKIIFSCKHHFTLTLFKMVLLDLLLFLTIGPQIQPVVMKVAGSFVLWSDVSMLYLQVLDISVTSTVSEII